MQKGVDLAMLARGVSLGAVARCVEPHAPSSQQPHACAPLWPRCLASADVSCTLAALISNILTPLNAGGSIASHNAQRTYSEEIL